MAVNFQIRNAMAQDVDRLNEVAKISKMFWNYPIEWLKLWNNDLTLVAENLIELTVQVAEVNHEIVGFGALKEREDNYEIMHLWVIPEVLRKGLGKALLNSLLTRLKSQKPIVVESDPNAVGFYKKMAFILTGKVPGLSNGRFLPVLMKENKTIIL